MKFKHKGLQALFEKNDSRRIRADLVQRIRHILSLLDAAQSPSSIDSRPGFRLHRLKGGRAGQWSMSVSANWRIVFRFIDGEAVDIDLVDYH